MKLDMIGVITDNFQAMIQFYKTVLGMEVSLEMEHYVEFKTPGTRFAISTSEVMHQATGHGSYREKRAGQPLELAFLVDSPEEVDTQYQVIVDKGATPIKSPEDMPWGQRAAFFADPDGNIHELFANLPESS